MHDDPDLGLGDIFTYPPSPSPPPPTIAHYYPHEGGQLSIRLVGTHPLWGHHLWNAARCFSSYLERNSNTLCKGKTVLELGAGGGLPGITALRCGARKVVLTDYPDDELLENLKINVDTNVPISLRDGAVIKGYLWGQPTSDLISSIGNTDSRFDLILMSDLVFNHSQHDALLQAAELSLSWRNDTGTEPTEGDTPCVLVFYTHHRPRLANRDLDFFVKARARGWTCEEIVTERFKPMFPEDPGDEDVRSTVHGWRMQKHGNLSGLVQDCVLFPFRTSGCQDEM